MPYRSAPFCLLLAVPALYVGCGSVAAKPESSRTTNGARAERIIPSANPNPFVGDWGPVKGYVANDWTARFTADGRMSIQGPGLIARGTYVVRGPVAEVNYRLRNGEEPIEADMAHAAYRLGSEGELTFSTGLPDDPPVHLRVIR